MRGAADQSLSRRAAQPSAGRAVLSRSARKCCSTIIKLNLSRVEKRVQENHKVPFTYDDSVPELIGKRCTELERGARMVDALITNTLLPEIGREFLNRLAAGSDIRRVHVGATDKDFTLCVRLNRSDG